MNNAPGKERDQKLRNRTEHHRNIHKWKLACDPAKGSWTSRTEGWGHSRGRDYTPRNCMNNLTI